MPEGNRLTIGKLLRDGVLQVAGGDVAMTQHFRQRMRGRVVTTRLAQELKRARPVAILPTFRFDDAIEVADGSFLEYDAPHKRYNRLTR